MKKYIQPITNLLVISAERQLLAGSNNLSNGVDGLDDVSTSDSDFGGGAVDSRRRGLWDDED